MFEQMLDEPLTVISPPFLKEYQAYESEALKGERAAINGGRIIRDWSVEDRTKYCLISVMQQTRWINASYYVDKFSSIDLNNFKLKGEKGENLSLEEMSERYVSFKREAKAKEAQLEAMKYVEQAKLRAETIKVALLEQAPNKVRDTKAAEKKLEKAQSAKDIADAALAEAKRKREELIKKQVEEQAKRDAENKATHQAQFEEEHRAKRKAEEQAKAPPTITGAYDLSSARAIFGLTKPTPELLAWILKYHNKHLHPDRNGGDAAKMAQINQTYQILTRFYK